MAELDDRRTTCVVSALIKLAHELDMDVIAEGVETADHVRALREEGCDLAQGAFFAPALDPDQGSALVSSPSPAEATPAGPSGAA